MLFATLTALAMIAFQMAAKATRDALFLSSFPVSSLPAMVIVAAVVSVLLAYGATRALTALGPGRVVPGAFVASAVLLLLEWSLIDTARRVVAIAVYLHVSGLGAVLISGFWSTVNERFDPRTVKKRIGRIAAGGTVGGVIGGLLAERSAVLLSVPALLPILAILHVACAGLVLGVGGSGGPRAGRAADGGGSVSSWGTITRTGYLRGLVAVVLLTTMAEGLIDYVFKAEAATAFGDGESLLRFFAAFYTGVAVLTMVLQAVGSRVSLERLGLGRTVALLPATAALGGVGVLLAPGFGSVVALRGSESVVRNGMYRAGYELLFAPLAPRLKRAIKALVDVGIVRFGDILGGAVVQAFLILAVGTGAPLVALAVGLSVVGASVAIGLQRGYVLALERSLVSRVGQLDLAEARDATRTAMFQSAGGFGVPVLEPLGAPADDTAARASAPRDVVRTAHPDPESEAVAALRSRDPAVVRRQLQTRPFPRGLVAYAIPLLAWDEIAHDAIDALRDAAARTTGQLVDRLLDPDEDFAVRRRLPLVLAECFTQRAADGLLDALRDLRFEVRYRCGRALSRLVGHGTEVRVDRRRVEEAVLREVAVDRGVWESHRLLDRMEDESWSPMMDEVLRDRANRSLEHVFTMLALVLPAQPLKIAFRGLHADDAHLRGTALEYLESALPDAIRKALWPFLEDARPTSRDRRSAETVLNELLQSNASIVMNLEAVRRRRGEGPS